MGRQAGASAAAASKRRRWGKDGVQRYDAIASIAPVSPTLPRPCLAEPRHQPHVHQCAAAHPAAGSHPPPPPARRRRSAQLVRPDQRPALSTVSILCIWGATQGPKSRPLATGRLCTNAARAAGPARATPIAHLRRYQRQQRHTGRQRTHLLHCKWHARAGTTPGQACPAAPGRPIELADRTACKERMSLCMQSPAAPQEHRVPPHHISGTCHSAATLCQFCRYTSTEGRVATRAYILCLAHRPAGAAQHACASQARSVWRGCGGSATGASSAQLFRPAWPAHTQCTVALPAVRGTPLPGQPGLSCRHLQRLVGPHACGDRPAFACASTEHPGPLPLTPHPAPPATHPQHVQQSVPDWPISRRLQKRHRTANCRWCGRAAMDLWAHAGVGSGPGLPPALAHVSEPPLVQPFYF